MPLGPDNTRQVWRIYANNQSKPLVSITYRRRRNNQSMGLYVDYTLHNCREKKDHRGGETIRNDMTSRNTTVWQIYQESLDNAGVTTPPTIGDWIIEADGTIWNVESTDNITEQLYGNVWNLDSRRLR